MMTAVNRWRDGCPKIPLNGFDVRLLLTGHTMTFGYFLRVRREDRARLLLGGVGEDGVVKSACSTPLMKVGGAMDSSASVALSSRSPVTRPDTIESMCDSNSHGMRYRGSCVSSGATRWTERRVGN